ncbi:MAG: PilZ domain-containing protein [Gammaproteobacteria bacterium]|nr:PilZ domain-containing protein [Gammaproteobacteria bacterium]
MSDFQPNRRRHKRVSVDSCVLDSSEFTALDLSESGMQLSSAIERRVGRTFDLNLMLEGHSLALKVEVIWCKKASSVFETGYRLGVQFVGHSVAQQLLIGNFVQKHLENDG